MKRIGMGLVGAGFVGPHHVDAVRRLGFVDIVAVAGSNDASGQAKAEALGARRGYGSYQALIDDPEVQVVHNATPNYLHYEVTSAALAKGKHVVSDKPLAMTAAESKRLVEEARRAGVVTAVTFNYRGNPLVQQARQAIARGDIGTPHFLHGHYLQDWLLKDTDYSWRLDPEKGGASSALGDIGSHWCDLAQHVTGRRITHVLGDITTVVKQRKKPRGSREAFQTGGGGEVDVVDIARRGSGVGAGAVRQRRAAAASRSARCAPATRTISCSRCAARRRRCGGGRSTRTSSGSAIATARTRCCRRTRRCSTPETRGYAHLPGGHQEAWADAFCNLMRDIYAMHRRGPALCAAAADGGDVRRRLAGQPHRRRHPRERRARRRLDRSVTS